jgi:hypothetical protein
MTIVAFTWQRYHKPLTEDARTWRELEKITMAAEAEAQHPYAGMSVLDILWQDLDDCMDQLMEQGAPERSSLIGDFLAIGTRDQRGMRAVLNTETANELGGSWYDTLKGWGELRGQAQGLAFAIAILTNPYAADVPAVKKEAMARWETRNP